MNILIEGEKYTVDLLEEIFDDPKFYKVNGSDAIITSVGYYHSFERNQLVFMIPKVFMKDTDKTVLDVDKLTLADLISNISVKHKSEFNWIRQLSVHFYNSLLEYKKRYASSLIFHETEIFDLNTNIGSSDYSYLDILLSFVHFYKKNNQQILFKYIEFISTQLKKPKWDNTVRKSLPIFIEGKTPLYIEVSNRKKIKNEEEELIIYFLSIINHLNKQHVLNIKLDKIYPIIKDNAFENLRKTGVSKLRRIKHRYFSDTLRRMYALCEMYFSQFDQSSVRKKREDYIAVTNYNLVFEDMVDKLFSDEIKETNERKINGITIKNLKHNDDGKIIDHLFDYKSLIDTTDIFYIGDSKYYKSDSEAGKLSKYKQFTYAKNVIQFNVDLLNVKGEQNLLPLRYRDQFTEGYNISPNFFIYGYIENGDDYDNASVIKKGKPVASWHFKERLFDRDTLFVHQYRINFLFVLKAYTARNNNFISSFRENIKKDFRDNFLDFFNNEQECGFKFFQSILSKEEHEDFIRKHFRVLNGKIFRTIDKRLLLAVHQSDNISGEILSKFTIIDRLL